MESLVGVPARGSTAVAAFVFAVSSAIFREAKCHYTCLFTLFLVYYLVGMNRMREGGAVQPCLAQALREGERVAARRAVGECCVRDGGRLPTPWSPGMDSWSAVERFRGLEIVEHFNISTLLLFRLSAHHV